RARTYPCGAELPHPCPLPSNADSSPRYCMPLTERNTPQKPRHPSRRGPPREASLRRKSLLDREQPIHQVTCERLGAGDIVCNHPTARLALLILRCLFQKPENLGQRSFELLDVATHEKKLSLDLLDRVVLRHHLLDALDLTHDARGIHTLRALVLALPADT